MTAFRCVLLSMFLLASASGRAPAEAPAATLLRLERPEGIPTNRSLSVSGVSADGRVAVGGASSSSRAYVWRDGVPEILPSHPVPHRNARAGRVTPDGRVILGGTTDGFEAFVWRDGVLEVLERPDVWPPSAVAADVTPDGRLIVGTVKLDDGGVRLRTRAARWVDGALELMADPPGEVTVSYTSRVSRDGRIVLGTINVDGQSHTARWVDGVPELLPRFPGATWISPLDMSDDGSVVVGYGWNGTTHEGFRFENGVTEALGSFAGPGLGSRAVSVSADGKRILGYAQVNPPVDCRTSLSCFEEFEPFVWTHEQGMQRFEGWLQHGCGLDLPNWHLGAGRQGPGGHVLLSATTTLAPGDLAWFTVDPGACPLDFDTPEHKAAPGDLYFIDNERSSVYFMDGESGAIKPISSYAEIYRPSSLEVGPHRELYVLSEIWDRIIRVDPDTGEQAVLSAGGLIDDPGSMAIGRSGALYVLTGWLASDPDPKIVRIDPATGEQSVLTTQGFLQGARGLTGDRAGHLVTTSFIDGFWWVVEIDESTGEQRLRTRLVELTSDGLLDDLEVDVDRNVLVARFGNDLHLMEFDLETGLGTELAGRQTAHRVALGPGGDISMLAFRTFRRLGRDTGELEVITQWGHLDKPWDLSVLRPRCSDGFDNDGDGLHDADDPACIGSDDDSERFRTDITIDVRPFSHGDVIRLDRNAPIPVAILGSPVADVDAIDGATLRFGPSGAEPLLDLEHWLVRLLSTFDLDGDGEDDLLAWFDRKETDVALGDTELCLEGEIDGVPFTACDSVDVVLGEGCHHPHAAAGVPFALPALLALRRRRRA